MAITRRQFLKRSSLVTAGTLLGPQLFSNRLMRQAYAALEDNDRYFVVLFLDGGNDGLNTVIPHDGNGDPEGLLADYNAARGTGPGGIRIIPDDLDASLIGKNRGNQTQLALHPGFNVPGNYFQNGAGTGGLKSLYDDGKVAVIQGCGYPEYSLSHEEARIIWETGDPLGQSAAGTGWVGRHLSAEYTGHPTILIPAVNINDSIVGEFRQSGTSVLAVRDLDNFTFPFDNQYEDDIGDDPDPTLDVGSKSWAFKQLALQAIAGGQPSSVYIGNTGKATLDSAKAYQSLSGLYNADRNTFRQMYANINNNGGGIRSSARDLREIARVIYGVEQGVPNVNARFFQMSNGGYDTHSDQGGADPGDQHFDLHAEVAGALNVFFQDLEDMGVANRVCVLVWSEFSRRIPQNDNGTDHGSQGPMFVIGGRVRGGVYGNHPNIDDLALDYEGNTEYTQNANNFRSTDFRDVYGTVFQHWMNLPYGTVQGLLPLDSTSEAISDPDHYWRSDNFDLKRSSDNLDLFDQTP